MDHHGEYAFDINTYCDGYVGWADGKFEKLWNVENSGESYYWNYVEFPDADFVTELERYMRSVSI